jgi:chromosome segregation ATPase
VLSLRRLERDERAQDLQSARTKVRDCRRELDEARMSEDRIRGQLEDARREKRLHERTGSRAADIQARMRHLEVLEGQLGEAGRRIEAARDASGRAARALEGARERLALAQAELRAVERHRDAWLDETRREKERRAEEDP